MNIFSRLCTKMNITAFLYYFVMEIAVIIWLFADLQPEYMLVLLVFITTMDRLVRRLLTNVYSPFPILPFAGLALFYDWAIPLAVLIPCILFILHLKKESKCESESSLKQITAKEPNVNDHLSFSQKVFHRNNYWNLFYLFVLEVLMFIYYFNRPTSPSFLIIVLLVLLFFTVLQQKGKTTLKSFYGFYPLLLLSQTVEWAVYAAMIFPLAAFIYQMVRKDI